MTIPLPVICLNCRQSATLGGRYMCRRSSKLISDHVESRTCPLSKFPPRVTAEIHAAAVTPAASTVPDEALDCGPADEPEDVAICEHKIKRLWSDEGQAILRAGKLMEQGTKWIVSAEAWNAAMQHRR